MKYPHGLSLYLRVTILMLATALCGNAQSFWTGASGTDTNWSDDANWSPAGAPGSGSDVVFTNLAAAATRSTNNFVDTDFTINSLSYSNSASTTNYHGTLIAPGHTLTIQNGLTVGSTNNATAVGVDIISGSRATLNLAFGNFLVQQGSGGDGGHQVVLDMSGLGTFTATATRFGVGVYTINNAKDSSGGVYLAKTNIINVINAGPTNSFLVNWNANSEGNNAANKSSFVYLGQTNGIFADSVTVGSIKSGGQTGGASTTSGLLAFNPSGLNNPTAYFRNGDTVSRVSFWEIGDDSLLAGSNQGANGTNDFSGGSIDALVDRMTIGVTGTGNSGGTTANGIGTFTMAAGKFNVNTLTNGWSAGNGATAGNVGSGTMNVNGTGNFTVNNLMVLASTAGSTGGKPVGTLNINGGTVQANSIIAGGGTSTINLTGGNLSLSNSVAGNLSQFSATNSTLVLSLASAPAITTTNLLLGGTSNLVSISAVPVISGYPATIPVITYGTLTGTFNMGLSNLPVATPAYKGYLTNNSSTLTINLVLTNGPLTAQSLVWVGQRTDADWDQNSTANWKTTGGATTTYHDPDFVTFDDTAVTNFVNLNGYPLQPSAVAMTNQYLNYTLGGSGNLSGGMSFTKMGAATLIMDTSGINDFSGTFTIGGGTVQIGNGDTQGNLGAGAVVNNGSLLYDRLDNVKISNPISGSGLLQIVTNGTMTLAGANTFTGPVTVANGGTLVVDNVSALGTTNSTVTVNNGARLDLGAPDLAANTLNFGLQPFIVSGSGPDGNGAVVNNGSVSQQTALRVLTLANTTTIGGNSRWDISGAGATLSTGSQPYGLVKTNANQVAIADTIVDPALGDIDIEQGSMQFKGNTTSMGNPANTIFVRAGATLNFSGTTNLWNKNFSLFSDGSAVSIAQLGTSSTIIGPMTLNTNCLFSVANAANTTLILSNTITGIGGITQTGGTNTLVLTGPAKAYTGPTIVNAGKLLLNTVLSGGSGLTNAFNTFVGGNGTNAGPVEIDGTLRPGLSGSPATFGAGGLTLYGSVIFDLNTNNTIGGGINDLVNVNGNLTLNSGAPTINPLGKLQTGTYRLFNYTGTRTGDFGSPASIGRYVFTTVYDDVNKQVNLNVSGGPASLRWVSTSSTAWDIQASQNWTMSPSGSTPTDVYYDADNVTFDDTTGVETNVSLSSAVSPTEVTNNSTANNFTIAGPGKISGATDIVKLGGSTLTISSSNDFTGTVRIYGGIVRVDNNIALGSTNGPTIVTNSGALDVGSPSMAANAVTLLEPIFVSGSGPGGIGAIINSSTNSQQNALRLVTLTADTTFGGPGNYLATGNPGRWDIRGGGATLSTGGQPYNLTKTGTNQVTLVDTAVDPSLANITVLSGSFGLQGATTLGDPTKTLTVSSNALLHCNALTNGNKVIVLDDGAMMDNTGAGTMLLGPITLLGSNSVNITATATFTNVISGPGSLYKSGAATLTLTSPNTYTGQTVILADGLSLTNAGSISQSTNIVLNAASATLDARGRIDQTLTLASGQTLQGIGTVAGNLTGGSGSTVLPGTNSIGTLTVSGTATLHGTNVMDIDKLNATNDVIAAGNIVYGGTLVVSNITSPLASGDSFQLYSATGYTGAFASITPATPGAGLVWNTNTLTTDGTLRVATGAVVPTTNASITKVTLSGTNLWVHGTNNNVPNTNFHYAVLTSTNIATHLSNWTAVVTNPFNPDGTFDYTNPIVPGTPRQFIDVQAVP